MRHNTILSFYIQSHSRTPRCLPLFHIPSQSEETGLHPSIHPCIDPSKSVGLLVVFLALVYIGIHLRMFLLTVGPLDILSIYD